MRFLSDVTYDCTHIVPQTDEARTDAIFTGIRPQFLQKLLDNKSTKFLVNSDQPKVQEQPIKFLAPHHLHAESQKKHQCLTHTATTLRAILLMYAAIMPYLNSHASFTITTDRKNSAIIKSINTLINRLT